MRNLQDGLAVLLPKCELTKNTVHVKRFLGNIQYTSSAATDTHATIEVLLETVFSI
jgi:hypothetical protein